MRDSFGKLDSYRRYYHGNQLDHVRSDIRKEYVVVNQIRTREAMLSEQIFGQKPVFTAKAEVDKDADASRKGAALVTTLFDDEVSNTEAVEEALDDAINGYMGVVFVGWDVLRGGAPIDKQKLADIDKQQIAAYMGMMDANARAAGEPGIDVDAAAKECIEELEGGIPTKETLKLLVDMQRPDLLRMPPPTIFSAFAEYTDPHPDNFVFDPLCKKSFRNARWFARRRTYSIEEAEAQTQLTFAKEQSSGAIKGNANLSTTQGASKPDDGEKRGAFDGCETWEIFYRKASLKAAGEALWGLRVVGATYEKFLRSDDDLWPYMERGPFHCLVLIPRRDDKPWGVVLTEALKQLQDEKNVLRTMMLANVKRNVPKVFTTKGNMSRDEKNKFTKGELQGIVEVTDPTQTVPWKGADLGPQILAYEQRIDDDLRFQSAVNEYQESRRMPRVTATQFAGEQGATNISIAKLRKRAVRWLSEIGDSLKDHITQNALLPVRADVQGMGESITTQVSPEEARGDYRIRIDVSNVQNPDRAQERVELAEKLAIIGSPVFGGIINPLKLLHWACARLQEDPAEFAFTPEEIKQMMEMQRQEAQQTGQKLAQQGAEMEAADQKAKEKTSAKSKK